MEQFSHFRIIGNSAGDSLGGNFMGNFSEYYDARQVIHNILKDDLVGPVFEDEVLNELPTQYYVMGKLYPRQDESIIESNTQSDYALYDETNSLLSMSSERQPSAMGITFILKKNIQKFNIHVDFARYELLSENSNDACQDVKQWKRKHYEYIFPFAVSNEEELIQNKSISIKDGEKEMANLKIYCHHVLPSGEKIFTASLVNAQYAEKDSVGNVKNILFQCHFKIGAEIAAFEDIEKKSVIKVSEETLNMEMLYQSHKCYAQGHGCAARWDNNEAGPKWIETTVLPSFDVLQMKPAAFNLPVFQMKYLSEEHPEAFDLLRDFIDQYKKWISTQEEKLLSYAKKYQNVGKVNLKRCRQAAEQIDKTINILEESYNARGVKSFSWYAFKLANMAMYLQRKQTLKNRGITNISNISWYPFQLAFILHELISFIEPEGIERKKADLLWFPTGGGKTEAYLGIAAFVIFLRGLKNSGNHGVTVIMRYTLRLLTLQQFARASMMIIACEILRKKYKLFDTPISIGLWVGNNLTPNKLKDAEESLNQLKRTGNAKHNPMQLKRCPWCGKPLNLNNYIVDIKTKKMYIRCSNPECPTHLWEEGLPVYLIDESIYEYRPSFLVATVDKFAQLPLRNETFRLFGKCGGIQENNPPELIIQDELHLISGPLGTVTGDYEVIVDKFCESGSIPVKIIASTATIKNAANQIKSLYGRKYTQFPPQGITCDDSFFAIVSDKNDKPSREYLGIMGVGTTATTVFIRVNASILYASKYLVAQNYSEKVIDNYWTIVDYFNTLRELGGAATQIVDDVQSRYEYLCENKFFHKYQISEELARQTFDHYEELTSRKDSSQIGEILEKRLPMPFSLKKMKDAYNFVLSSNMISVGIDIDRLGCMVVLGQPKSNAEYIQATSRVGRSNPGLVVTIYNGARSRDRSHYEQFMRYHSSLYRYVEATSLTPFSDRARDRGLQAIFIALCRFYIDELSSNEDAGCFDKNDISYKNKLDEIKQFIVQYVQYIEPQEAKDTEKELNNIIDEWHQKAKSQKNLKYKDYRNKAHSLIKDDTDLENRFRMMNSMRSVELMSDLYLERRD